MAGLYFVCSLPLELLSRVGFTFLWCYLQLSHLYDLTSCKRQTVLLLRHSCAVRFPWKAWAPRSHVAHGEELPSWISPSSCSIKEPILKTVKEPAEQTNQEPHHGDHHKAHQGDPREAREPASKQTSTATTSSSLSCGSHSCRITDLVYLLLPTYDRVVHTAAWRVTYEKDM